MQHLEQSITQTTNNQPNSGTTNNIAADYEGHPQVLLCLSLLSFALNLTKLDHFPDWCWCCCCSAFIQLFGILLFHYENSVGMVKGSEHYRGREREKCPISLLLRPHCHRHPSVRPSDHPSVRSTLIC